VAVFDRAVRALMKRLEGLIALMLALMVVLVFGNVVLRYGFNSGIAVSEELSRYLFIWLTFMGAVIAVHERAHLGVDSLPRLLPRTGRLACAVASEALMLASTALLFTGSWKQVLVNLATKSPVSGTPLALIYVAGLAASVMMGALFVRNLYTLLVVGASDEELILSVESEDLAGVERASRALISRDEGRR
jgi:TRAP-type C4-dicarboxylate transport system permease small subunit